jgi:hypothetical protein
VFKKETITKANFMRVLAQMETRTFGWGEESLFMAPMADNLNHHNRSMDQRIINTKLHLEAEPKHDYFTGQKYICNYKPLFD